MIRQKFKHGSTILLAFCLLAACEGASIAATIDDFSTPQGPLGDAAVSGVTGPGIIGGSRQAGGGFFFEVAGGVGTFSFFRAGNVMGLTYDGTPALDDISTFPPVDLTDGGLASHFLLGISGIDGGLSMAMGVRDVDGNTASAIFSAMMAPGLYTLPLPTGLGDLTRIHQIGAALFLSPFMSSGASVSIDFLCTGTPEAGCTSAEPVAAVPEPGTATLFTLGVAMLVLLVRKKASTEIGRAHV